MVTAAVRVAMRDRLDRHSGQSSYVIPGFSMVPVMLSVECIFKKRLQTADQSVVAGDERQVACDD